MDLSLQMEPISVDAYLAAERRSEVRHEYLGGALYPLVRDSDEHATLCSNLAFALRDHLEGKTCRVQMADAKVRLRLAGEEVFYYPDVMVTCDPRDTERYFKRYPLLLIEVLSDTTEALDRREKFLSYRQIETLEEYVLVAQDKMEVTVFRRSCQWQPQVLRLPNQVLHLVSVDLGLPLQEVYEGVRF
jgi:Uma2 family endonuclease